MSCDLLLVKAPGAGPRLCLVLPSVSLVWAGGGDAEPGCRHQSCRSHAAAAATCTTCTLQAKQKIFSERRKYLHIKWLQPVLRRTDTGASGNDVVWGWMMVFTYNEVIKHLQRLKDFIQDSRSLYWSWGCLVFPVEWPKVSSPLLWPVSEAEVESCAKLSRGDAPKMDSWDSQDGELCQVAVWADAMW